MTVVDATRGEEMTDLATLATQERTGLVTVGGNPITLLGNEVKQGDPAPDFTVTGNDMKPISLSDFRGKLIVLATVGSLDTGTCDVETKTFNEKLADYGDGLVCLVVSCDLPFAQRRWCAAAGVENVITASDHKDTECGLNYGVLGKETRLLARCVFVIDQDFVVRYVQLVPEVSNEPDYAPVIQEIEDLIM